MVIEAFSLRRKATRDSGQSRVKWGRVCLSRLHLERVVSASIDRQQLFVLRTSNNQPPSLGAQSSDTMEEEVIDKGPLFQEVAFTIVPSDDIPAAQSEGVSVHLILGTLRALIQGIDYRTRAE